ncbi:tyrosine-type recombinase/integrase [Gottfriedia acidiceleris]|uniref:tyrosine-type recombinase/integrase n=1 Tax=Gottfriedia acidiceleris TaxID=371036 RepID=UPI003D193F51
MSIKKKGNTWSFRIDIGKNPETGNRRQLYKSGFTTKKAAELAKAELLTSIKNDGYHVPSNETLAQLMINWLETTYRHEVQITTFEKTVGIVTNRLIPAFKHALVREIKPLDLQLFFADRFKEGLSPAYIKTMRNILNKAFNTAITWEIIDKNPMEAIKGPSIKNTKKAVWNETEIIMFLDHCEELRWKVAFNLALNTGVRRGELLALRWSNIDFKENTLLINEALTRTKEHGLLFKEPKSKNSNRKILIPESIVELLKQLKEEQVKIKLQLGNNYHANDLVVATYDGKPIDPRNLVRKFKQITEIAGLKKIAFHGLRHSNATLLMNKGVNPKIVSVRLGHSNIGITLDLYSHTDLEIQKRATESLESIFSIK